MRKLRENALRARLILEREAQPLTEECREVIAQDVARALSEYFHLTGGVTLRVVRGEDIRITVEATADSVLAFGVVK